MGGQNDKILLKVFKSFRIIPKKKKKKKTKIFFKIFGGPRPPLGPINDSPLFVPDSLNPNSYWQSLKITRIYIYIYIYIYCRIKK